MIVWMLLWYVVMSLFWEVAGSKEGYRGGVGEYHYHDSQASCCWYFEEEKVPGGVAFRKGNLPADFDVIKLFKHALYENLISLTVLSAFCINGVVCSCTFFSIVLLR